MSDYKIIQKASCVKFTPTRYSLLRREAQSAKISFMGIIWTSFIPENQEQEDFINKTMINNENQV